MDPWAVGRLFPSAEYGRQPRQELNALVVLMSAACGAAAIAAPPAFVAFLPVAAASGACLWRTPPYCVTCQRITRHELSGRTHVQTEIQRESVPRARIRHVFVSRYRCNMCGTEISRQTHTVR
jgi:hypothetical protein